MRGSEDRGTGDISHLFTDSGCSPYSRSCHRTADNTGASRVSKQIFPGNSHAPAAAGPDQGSFLLLFAGLSCILYRPMTPPEPSRPSPRMKTIVILENPIVELNSLVGIFKKWQKEINVLTAREEEAAIDIISSRQVDLIVCNLSLPEKKEFEGPPDSPAHFPLCRASP